MVVPRPCHESYIYKILPRFERQGSHIKVWEECFLVYRNVSTGITCTEMKSRTVRDKTEKRNEYKRVKCTKATNESRANHHRNCGMSPMYGNQRLTAAWKMEANNLSLMTIDTLSSLNRILDWLGWRLVVGSFRQIQR